MENPYSSYTKIFETQEEQQVLRVRVFYLFVCLFVCFILLCFALLWFLVFGFWFWFLVFRDRITLCSPAYPGTQSVHQAGLDSEIHLPLPPNCWD